MKILITGVCGFAGSVLATALRQQREGVSVVGIDNLSRPGSETNRLSLRRRGVEVRHGDLRAASDLEELPAVDWVIDAAANPSVLAGTRQGCTSRQAFEHNLAGTVNVLEYCKRHRAGFILLSSSRVYSIEALNTLPLREEGDAFALDAGPALPAGLSADGIEPGFSTRAPVSLYGGLKLAAEAVALEYGAAFDFPVWINRCGVLAGAGQFGTPDQGIVSYWLHAHARRRELRYFGFGGSGRQVRDLLHPRDLAVLLDRQMAAPRAGGERIYTAGGGPRRALSLAALTAWCDQRFGAHAVTGGAEGRAYDVPWVVMSNRAAQADFAWVPEITAGEILDEIAARAESLPGWLELSGL
jgi:CDP-paratose 2-epimerase